MGKGPSSKNRAAPVTTDRSSTRLLNSFFDVGLRLTQDFDINRVLVEIVERSMALTGARYGAAVTLDDNGGIEDFLHRGLSAEEVALLPHLPVGRGLLGLVLSERRVVRTENLGTHEASVGFPSKHVPMDALLGVPLRHRGELVGGLYLTKSPGDPAFTQDDEDLVVAMGAMAAVGIVNARLFAAEAESAQRSSLIGQITATVGRSLDPREVLTTSVAAIGAAAGADRCFIRLLDESGSSLAPVEHEWVAEGVSSLSGLPESQYPISSLVFATGETQWTTDVTTDPRLDGESPDHAVALAVAETRAALSTPLRAGNRILGVVALHSRRPRAWTAAEISMIEDVAGAVAVAAGHAQLYEDAVKTAERLRDLDALRSNFISMVSHELRSPMAVIAGIADMLERKGDSLEGAQRQRLVTTLGREARRLGRLVSEVLDLETMERGGIRLDKKECALGALVAEAAADAGIEERSIITMEPGNDVVSADRDKLKQVLLNLIGNAVKYSPTEAPVTVTMTPGRDEVSVRVGDAGPGIAADDLERVFEPFSRLTAGGPERGWGLGLYLSRLIVEAHGGAIHAASDPGSGATFSFTVPRV